MSQQIIGLLNPLLAMVFGLAFVIFWVIQKQRRYVLLVALGYFSFSCGMFISNVGISAQDLLHVLGTHFFYSLALISLVWAVSWRSHSPPRIPLNLAIVTFVTPFIVWLHSNSDLANLRVIVANIAYSAVLLLGALNLWQSRKNSKLEYWLFILFILLAVQGLVRPVGIFWLEGAVTNADYRESIYYSTLNLSMSFLSLLLALSLLAICAYDYSRDMQSRSSESKNRNALEKTNLERLQNVMATNIHRNHDLTIKLLASEIGIQTHELRKLINNQLAFRNFREFVNSHRIKEAQVMLTDPQFADLSITKIAFDCGFNSIPSFNRVFKTEVGMPPSEYRDQHVKIRTNETVD